MSLLFSKPFSYLFFSTLLLGMFMSISSSNWFMIWMGLELNLYSFIPLLAMSKLNQEKEASVKYFLTQALASALLLFSSLMIPFSILGNSTLLIALFMKLAVAPFHFWLPSVMNSISWSMCWILTTIQKIAPMTITIAMTQLSSFTLTVVMISGLVGGMGGLAQTQLRAIFAYSSIGHMAWIISAAMISSTLSMFYFISYIMMISSIMLPMTFTHTKSINFSSLLNKSLPMQMILITSILSLSGMPPLFGFFPKMFVISAMVKTKMFFLLIMLLISSSINLYYYTKILMGFFFASPKHTQLMMNSKPKAMLLVSILFSLTATTAIVLPMMIPYSFYALTLFY
uniref:NADH-ubiquinone oxidoreductase chain 2 n=1 Tax=Terebellides stroemii TaxID=1037239 RepID=B3TJX8_9ANNE|nr:NADH dehydrogenase subunit 2 [Terebellides stroemii]ABW76484.1 NADH dehydrogenase subunit 2 [Terebellides stroemii]